MNKVLSIFIVLIIAGCSVGYKPYTHMSGGYKDSPLGEGRHSLEYVAYKSTTEEILPRWHKRAAEICPAGYDVISLNQVNDDSPIPIAPTTSGNVTVSASVARNDVYISGEIKCKN